eukprot:tig00020944_g16363.t1
MDYCVDPVRTIFTYYAGLGVEAVGAVKTKGWNQQRQANTSISLGEFLSFGRQFNLFPDLMSITGVTRMFRAANTGFYADDNDCSIDFREFQELLCRLAIMCFGELPEPSVRVRAPAFER